MTLHAAAVAVDPPRGPAEQHRAGRAAAAEALRRAGSPSTRVGRRRDGAPLFPQGFAGSVTHTTEVALAVVADVSPASPASPAPRATGPGIGVDLETRLPHPRAARLLLDERERAQLWPDADTLTLRRLLVAKEAAFKALSSCRSAHGGLFWRVRLQRRDGLLLAAAGDHRALVTVLDGPGWAAALAVGVDLAPGVLGVLAPGVQLTTHAVAS